MNTDSISSQIFPWFVEPDKQIASPRITAAMMESDNDSWNRLFVETENGLEYRTDTSYNFVPMKGAQRRNK